MRPLARESRHDHGCHLGAPKHKQARLGRRLLRIQHHALALLTSPRRMRPLIASRPLSTTPNHSPALDVADVHRPHPRRHQTLPTTCHQINNSFAGPAAASKQPQSTVAPPMLVHVSCMYPSPNHAAPNLSVAVALRCVQLGRAHFVAVKMGSRIDQCLNMVCQACRRCQEERGIA